MSYNLLIDSEFNNNGSWKTINCSFKNGVLRTKGKVFGIKQKLILPDPTRLYFRVEYKALTPIKDIKVGILKKDKLFIVGRSTSTNRTKAVSIVESIEDEEVEIYIICESLVDGASIELSRPVLIDLKHQKKSYMLKWLLDKKLSYRKSYSYKNILGPAEISKVKGEISGDPVLHNTRIGTLFEVKQDCTYTPKTKLTAGHFYLYKLDFEEVNNFGELDLTYGAMNCLKGHEQLWIVFKANSDLLPTVKLNHFNYEQPYIVNLKRDMLIDITTMQLQAEDIERLTFI